MSSTTDTLPLSTTTDTLPRLLTCDEAAALLQVRPQTLAVWRSSRRHPELRYVRVGRSIRYRYADLLAYLAARTV